VDCRELGSSLYFANEQQKSFARVLLNKRTQNPPRGDGAEDPVIVLKRRCSMSRAWHCEIERDLGNRYIVELATMNKKQMILEQMIKDAGGTVNKTQMKLHCRHESLSFTVPLDYGLTWEQAMSTITQRAHSYLDNLAVAPIVKFSYVDDKGCCWSVSDSSTYASFQKFSQRNNDEVDVLLIRVEPAIVNKKQMTLQQMIKDAGGTVNKTQMKLEMPKGKASW
jgi:hypothetical protein